jgi:hypothetical protein
LPKEHYKTLTALHASLPLFFQPWWLDVVCKDWDVALLEKDNTIEAVFPFQIEQKWGLKLIRNPLLTPYLGPFFMDREKTGPVFETGKALPEIFSRLPEWDYFQMEALPEFRDFPALDQLGFANRALRTYYLDLQQTEKELLDHIHPRRRNYIRKAAMQLSVTQESSPDLALFYQWHKRAFEQKKQYYPYSLSFFEKITGSAEAMGASLFLTAKNKAGETVAMIWTPFDADRSYHLLSAYHPGNKINGAMDLLVWEAVKIAKSGGRKIYDFEGSMDPGIASFFRKFGGTPETYFSFMQNRSLIWKIKKALLD